MPVVECDFVGCLDYASIYIKFTAVDSGLSRNDKIYLCSLHKDLILQLRRQYRLLEAQLPKVVTRLNHTGLLYLASAIQLRKFVYAALKDLGFWKVCFRRKMDQWINLLFCILSQSGRLLPTTEVCQHTNCNLTAMCSIDCKYKFCDVHAPQMGLFYYAVKGTETFLPLVTPYLSDLAQWQIKMDRHNFISRLKSPS